MRRFCTRLEAAAAICIILSNHSSCAEGFVGCIQVREHEVIMSADELCFLFRHSHGGIGSGSARNPRRENCRFGRGRIAATLTARGVPTKTGAPWSPQAIRNILGRENPQPDVLSSLFRLTSQAPIAPRSGDASGHSTIRTMSSKKLLILTGLLLAWACAGCSNVNVLRLTSETFPPRAVDEVEILSQEPTTEHLRVAELSETSTSSVDKLQRHILKKAAELGAHAVVFTLPSTHTEQRVAYQPVYSPWGYYAPYYYGPGPYGYWGPWGYGWGYQYYVPVWYFVRVTTLKGLAIRYSGS